MNGPVNSSTLKGGVLESKLARRPAEGECPSAPALCEDTYREEIWGLTGGIDLFFETFTQPHMCTPSYLLCPEGLESSLR